MKFVFAARIVSPSGFSEMRVNLIAFSVEIKCVFCSGFLSMSSLSLTAVYQPFASRFSLSSLLSCSSALLLLCVSITGAGGNLPNDPLQLRK